MDRGLKLEGLREGLLGLGLSIALASGDRAEIARRLEAITDRVPASAIHRRMGKLLDDPARATAELRDIASTADDTEKVVVALWAAHFGDAQGGVDVLVDVIPRRAHPGNIWHPVFADARRLPGFTTLVADLGLADYWRVHGYGDFCEPAGDRIECH